MTYYKKWTYVYEDDFFSRRNVLSKVLFTLHEVLFKRIKFFHLMKLVCQKEQEAPSSGIIIIVFSSLRQCGQSKKFRPPKRGDDDGKFLHHAALKKCRFFSPPHGEGEETAAVFPHFPFSSEEALLFLSAHHPFLLPPLIYTRELSCFQIYCCRRKRRGKRERRVPAPFPSLSAPRPCKSGLAKSTHSHTQSHVGNSTVIIFYI